MTLGGRRGGRARRPPPPRIKDGGMATDSTNERFAQFCKEASLRPPWESERPHFFSFASITQSVISSPPLFLVFRGRFSRSFFSPSLS